MAGIAVAEEIRATAATAEKITVFMKQ